MYHIVIILPIYTAVVLPRYYTVVVTPWCRLWDGMGGGGVSENDTDDFMNGGKKRSISPELINFSRIPNAIGIKFNFSALRFSIVIIFHWLFEVSFLERKREGLSDY